MPSSPPPPPAAATMLALPIARVLVMEDRAQIERRGEVELSGGPARLVVTGLPAVAVDRSLKVEVQGATLVDARIVRRWRERPPRGTGPDATALAARVRALEDDVALRADEVARLGARCELLAQARASLLRSVAEGTGAGRADGPAWTEALEALSARQLEADEALRQAGRDDERARARHAEALAAKASAGERDDDLECVLQISLDREGHGTASLRASYLCPCAVWRPAYRATLDGARVALETEAVVWQRTGEDWNDVALAFSTARPTLGTAPPTLEADRLTLRPKSAAEKRVAAVVMREEAPPSAGEASGGAPDLPGLDDGGEARLLEAPARARVPSDGEPHRVPLARFEAAAELEAVCPAELTPLVSLIARFPNSSGQVLLAGPVHLVRQSGFVGRSQIGFAAPGETVKLSFGSEDGLRVVRELEVEASEARLTGRRTKRNRVKLFVSNASAHAARLVIEERVPVSEVEEVEVKMIDKECQPAPVPSALPGLWRIPLELPANSTREARLVWDLSAAGKVAGV